jgi:hypothetical protein
MHQYMVKPIQDSKDLPAFIVIHNAEVCEIWCCQVVECKVCVWYATIGNEQDHIEVFKKPGAVQAVTRDERIIALNLLQGS